MNNTILNNGSPRFPQAAAGGSGTASTTTTGAPASASVEGPVGDQVKLTDSALALQQAARPDEAGAIDPKRVEQLRLALADGSYKVNSGRIAERMIAMDQQLGGTDKA